MVFVKPVSDEFDDAAFRFTDISYNSFSGYVHGDNESSENLQYDYEFELQYFIFETGCWEIGVESYSYSIIDGNDSGAFSIDTNTGEIEVADSSQLDYESGDIQYVLTLQVTNNATGTSDSVNLTINVNNVSDSINTEAESIDGQTLWDIAGWNISSAGDVDGDGLDDIIIGAPSEDTTAKAAGCAYVVFGSTDSTLPALSDVVNGNGGFVIYGENEDDNAGFAVSGGADINGDGLDDLVVGAPFADSNDDVDSGKAYVVFGKTNTTEVHLSDISEDYDNSGFVMNGAYDYDHAGGSLSLGDVNGDGLADILISEMMRPVGSGYNSYTDYTDENMMYVVYGKTDGFSVELADIASDDNEDGFAVIRTNRTEYVGLYWLSTVMSAGDFNTDGLMDFVLTDSILDGIDNYVALGKFDSNSISQFDDDYGFRIETDQAVTSF